MLLLLSPDHMVKIYPEKSCQQGSKYGNNNWNKGIYKREPLSSEKCIPAWPRDCERISVVNNSESPITLYAKHSVGTCEAYTDMSLESSIHTKEDCGFICTESKGDNFYTGSCSRNQNSPHGINSADLDQHQNSPLGAKYGKNHDKTQNSPLNVKYSIDHDQTQNSTVNVKYSTNHYRNSQINVKYGTDHTQAQNFPFDARSPMETDKSQHNELNDCYNIGSSHNRPTELSTKPIVNTDAYQGFEPNSKPSNNWQVNQSPASRPDSGTDQVTPPVYRNQATEPSRDHVPDFLQDLLKRSSVHLSSEEESQLSELISTGFCQVF